MKGPFIFAFLVVGAACWFFGLPGITIGCALALLVVARSGGYSKQRPYVEPRVQEGGTPCISSGGFVYYTDDFYNEHQTAEEYRGYIPAENRVTHSERDGSLVETHIPIRVWNWPTRVNNDQEEDEA